MAIQQTSRIAYRNDVLPTLGKRHEAVIKALCKRDDFSNSELASFLNWPINTVTPRVNELVKRNLVVNAGKRICGVTGKTVNVWRQVISEPKLFNL